jgi:hypothetical protein
MTNELSTKITRLDLNFILDNCFKPMLWDKQWTIFKYGKYKITFEISYINVKGKKVTCKLRLFENENQNCDTDYEINFQKENRNFEVIQNGINGKVFRWLIESAERMLITKTDAYREADIYQNKLVEAAETNAISFLDEQKIACEEIRDVYISSKRSDAYTWKFTQRVLDDYKGSKLTSLFLAYALFADDNTNYDMYKKLAVARGFKIGHLRKEIKAELAKLESGEMNKTLGEDK